MSEHCLNSEEVAKELNIPVLAVGQLVFEGRLSPTDENFNLTFKKEDVIKLKSFDLNKYC